MLTSLASIHQKFTKLKLQLEPHGIVDKTLAQQFEYSGLHRQYSQSYDRDLKKSVVKNSEYASDFYKLLLAWQEF